jgi:4-hydroxy-2-oxoheptanedioate aldolase
VAEPPRFFTFIWTAASGGARLRSDANERVLKPRSLRRKLASGRLVTGIFSIIPAPALVEIAGLAGLDFVVVDLEHGGCARESMTDMLRAATAVGISPVVRVKENSSVAILEALDSGAVAVQIPQVADKEGALGARAAARFHPKGTRGLNPYVRSASYSAQNKSDYVRASNDDIAVILQIEGVEGVRNLPEILTVEDIDVIFLGPYDLSQSLGVPGQVDHPFVSERMCQVIEQARRAGAVVGTFVDSAEKADRWIEMGVRYIAVSVDTGIFFNACRTIVETLSRSDAS